MKKSELKKEYKKYARQNKTKGYMFGLAAAIVVLIGMLIAMPISILTLMKKIDIVTHFTYAVPGVVILIIGIVLDIFAEVYKSRELKEFSQKQ